MPSLTVRAMAEMLRLPAYAQVRILSEQKYPKQGPQVFRTPYYQQALAGIRNFYRTGNDKVQLGAAMTKIQSIGQEARRLNNARVLESFRNGDIAKRALVMRPNSRVTSQIGSVELRLSPDLQAVEGNQEYILFLNCRATKLDSEVACLTSEIAHWVLEKNGIKLPISNIEYVDLFTGVIHSVNKRRAATTKALSQNVKIIETLWPTL